MPASGPSQPTSATAGYRWILLAVFVFFAVCFALHPEGPLRSGQLLDPDDYMRLNEVINWLRSAHPLGAGWFNLGHPRLDPGTPAIVHWARLVDVPIALFMLPLLSIMTLQSAALIASFIVPPLLFAVLLLLMPALARPLIGKRRGAATAVFLLFAPAVTMNFLPGRVDHHGYQIIIAAFGLLCMQRIVLCPRGWKAAITAAIAYACGLWIGTEALPWLVLFCGALALLAAWRGGFALRNAAVFGIALPLAVIDIMPLALPRAEYTSRALSWFSGADLIFAMLAAVVFIGGWLRGRATDKKWLRLLLMMAFGFFAAVTFVYQVPDILTGAYADYDAFFNQTLIANIGEAQPLAAALHINIHNPPSIARAALLFLHNAFLPSLAVLIVLWNLLRTQRRARLLWLMQGFFLLPALLMMLFWQIRVGWFAQIFSIVPVTWLALRWWRCIGARFAGRPRYWVEIIAFLLIAPLPVILLPAIVSEADFYPDLLLFPAARAAPVCPLVRASSFLDTAYGESARLILSGANEGPELLFRTNHKVLAAPFNVNGNRDAFTFFNARDDQAAMEVARRRQADLILVCRNIPYFYAGLGETRARFKAALFTDAQGRLRAISDAEHPTLIEKLTNNQAPGWLQPVSIPDDPDYLLFEVKLP